MKKLIKSKLFLQVIIASMVATLATAGIVGAVTTIGANIETAGTLAAGATTLTGTLAVSKGVTVGAAYGLDTVAGGILNIGTTTATTINLGSTAATVAVKGNLTFPSAYGLDSAGVLNIGTTTATTINVGRSGQVVAQLGNSTVAGTLGVTGLTTLVNASSTLASFGGGTAVAGLLFGTCAVNFGTSLGAGVATTTNCTATGVDSTYKVFLTPSNLETYVAFNSASSTGSGVIQVQVFNTSTSTPVTIASRTWAWMAIK